jgi:hypothetical protein
MIIFFHSSVNFKGFVMSTEYNYAIFKTSMSLDFRSQSEKTSGSLHELPIIYSPLEIIPIGDLLQW